MTNRAELAASETAASGNRKGSFKRGVVPANLFDSTQQAVSLQVNRLELQQILAHGGEICELLLKVGEQPAVQVIIRHLQYSPISGEIVHLDFYQVATT